MCGITGIVSPSVKSYQPNLRAMMSALKHRGPDGEGVYNFENCALGHTRLSIIDLEGGHQPMLSSDQSCGLVYNGEIYGYKEIRRSLNYPYQNKSDTEVILALYKTYGSKMLKHLPGMFAFSVWDDKQQTLFCARDRFGEKPFYYAFGRNKEFIFASEIKAILASNLVEPQLNLEAVAHYLNKLYVHPTQTIYANIFPLPPAHCLVYKNGKLDISRY